MTAAPTAAAAADAAAAVAASPAPTPDTGRVQLALNVDDLDQAVAF